MRNGILRQLTIKQLLFLGTGAFIGVFVLMSAGWIISVAQLSHTKGRLYSDAHSLLHRQSLEMESFGCGDLMARAAVVQNDE